MSTAAAQVRTRYLLPLLGLLAVTFVVIAAQAVRTQRTLLTRELSRSARATADDLAARSQLPLLLNDTSALRVMLGQAMANTIDAQRLQVVTDDGSIVVAIGDTVGAARAAAPAPADSIVRFGDALLATAVVRDAAGVPFALVAVRASTARIDAVVRRAAWQLFSLSAVGFLVVMLVARMLLSRIAQLASTLEERVEERTRELAEKSDELAATALFATHNPSPVMRFNRRGEVTWANLIATRLILDGKPTGSALGALLPELEALDFAQLVDRDMLLVREVCHEKGDFQVSFRGVAAHQFGHAYFADISELKRSEQALAEARDRALDANRLKSQFLANMSHEVRTPMNGVLGMLDLLHVSPLTEPQQEFVELASSSARHLLTIINDILDFSKIEAGRLELEWSPFDLRHIVEEVTLLISNTADLQKMQVVCHVDPTLPKRVVGDAVRLRQVLINLCSNAVKFTTSGLVEARVHVVARESTHVRVRFAITDTGVGMSPATVARLFVPFTQADSSTTRKYGGTGLGLSISSELVALMGGSLEVDSEEGRGSTFEFTIDLATVYDVEPASANSPTFGLCRQEIKEHTASSERPSTRADDDASNATGLKVLLAEDNAVNQLFAVRVLEQAGFTVDVVDTGRQAIEARQRERYAAILMDYQMPEMDGLEAATAIREWELASAEPPVPIIALTANAQREDADASARAGMNAYLSKPYTSQALTALLRQVAPGVVEPQIQPEPMGAR